MTSAVIVLALDTATAATTVAVLGPGVQASRTVIDAHGHVESLAPLIEGVLAASTGSALAIDVVACGVGPGPFTGLRVGVATAIAMGTVWQRPIVGVCTHEVLARAALRTVSDVTEWIPDGGDAVIVATSARRVECHVSRYDIEGRCVSGPVVMSHDETRLLISESGAVVAGDAWPLLTPDLIERRRGPNYPEALDLAAIVQERHESGEAWPDDDELDGALLDVALESANARGASTAAYLARRRHAGRVLLPARPLYLRQPDAVPSADRIAAAKDPR